ncbi:DUF2802 domain-containing protein [Thauera linaloolentis]|uniref:DUF2802 domain-containing protein n=1 Tax=Thauera linaloolentis (strain DSM 12138 / JCM 21573 / CCUG 41526 / CIP 105981 / IAM 15112 / NBRC 102519 / 47Lol) TaxID=1123367 RepID=N6ZBY1_THAL4|nr:DUF2802 domain-containing protein [Thauera linaloolentis]ENO89699.1 hypothetical protein C666_05285 [Thauera linaloolentis 47Lol = DSM 12138]MCM8567179.1 DUF2802 domain-containing protein [Thauera linaloolentis]
MSPRQMLWILALLLLLLAGWQFLRALWLGRASAPQSGPASAAMADEAGGEGDDGDGFDYAPQPRPAVSAPLAPEPAAPAADVFRAELEVSHLRRELEAQQALIALQRTEIEALRAEAAGLRQQLEEAMLAQPSTSPEYSEALRFAEQGYTAEEIAARCGITVAEAGLVLSLARTGGTRP